MRLFLPLLLAISCDVVQSADFNPQRARFHYQMFCQGCHTPDGAGARSVPQLKDFVGYFLDFPQGREYLVRVPGSAITAMNDEDLAEVLNWIVINFGADSVSKPFLPYTGVEVGKLRQRPLYEVERYRGQMLALMGAARMARDENEPGDASGRRKK